MPGVTPGQLFFYKNFYNNTHKLKSMNAERLKEILDKTPGQYEILFYDPVKKVTIPVKDKIEIDIENQKLILK